MLELLAMILGITFAVWITKNAFVFLAFMALLFKFTDLDRWWLWFAVIIVMLFKAGYRPGTIAVGVIFISFKILRDIFSTGKTA